MYVRAGSHTHFIASVSHNILYRVGRRKHNRTDRPSIAYRQSTARLKGTQTNHLCVFYMCVCVLTVCMLCMYMCMCICVLTVSVLYMCLCLSLCVYFVCLSVWVCFACRVCALCLCLSCVCLCLCLSVCNRVGVFGRGAVRQSRGHTVHRSTDIYIYIYVCICILDVCVYR